MEVNEIIMTMAHDLGIRQFSTEPELQYTIRVVYSSMSCWIKTSALDKQLTDPNTMGVSRKHILEKSKRVLDEILKRCPQASKWFYVEGGDDPISVIRTRLIQSGELIQVGYDTNLGLAEKRVIDYGYGLLQLVGSVYERPYLFSGIAIVASAGTKERVNNEDITNWFKKFINNAWWKEGSCVNENSEFFNSEKKSANNYSCWESRRTKSTYSVILTRQALNNRAYEYVLEKEEHGISYYHKLDPFLHVMYEYRRMMFALRILSNNPIKAYAKVYSDHIQLNLKTHLPSREAIILETFGWPITNIVDKLNWVFSIIAWPFVKHTLESVGIVIKEEHYG